MDTIREKALAVPRFVAATIDATAMYRMVSGALIFLAVVALPLGYLNLVPYEIEQQLLSLVVAVTVALVSDYLFGKLFKVSVNYESALITALIIHFLLIPPSFAKVDAVVILALTVFLAMASKFVFAWQKQHLANPAAIGLVLMYALFALLPFPGVFLSSWWIGNPAMIIPLVLAGAAVVAKVRKWTPVLSFLAVAFLVFLFEEWRFSGDPFGKASTFWLSGPSLFLAFFMLTEPFTMPPSKRLQVGYGALVGFLSQTTLFRPFITMTPELALVLGNVAFYGTTLRRKLIVPLTAVREVAKDTFEFAFKKPVDLRFRAGQYLEWMLPHENPDNRGIRRYFTIVSAPADPELKLTVRFGERISSFKQALKAMRPGDTITASQLAGDFVLPNKATEKLALVAGGIGVTPFISQIGHLAHANVEKPSVVLFYCNNTTADIAYQDRLQAATRTLPLKVVHVLAKEQVPPHEHGFLTEEMIRRHTPDYLERTWYISGPPGMVNAYAALLRKLGVKRYQIVRDFFPGLA